MAIGLIVLSVLAVIVLGIVLLIRAVIHASQPTTRQTR
jgi:hypothetical protein